MATSEGDERCTRGSATKELSMSSRRTVEKTKGFQCVLRVFVRACTVESHLSGSLPLYSLDSDSAHSHFSQCQIRYLNQLWDHRSAEQH